MGWVLGIVVLGVGLYAFARSRGISFASETKKAYAGSPAPTSFESPPRYLADPWRVVRGQRYRMRLRAELTGDLSTQGFDDVETFLTPEDLPPSWPLAMRDRNDPETTWASGTWVGPSGTAPRVRGVWQIWPTAEPS